MPAMPRPNKKATRIAFKIIGIPPCMQKVKETPKKRRQRRELDAEDSRFIR